MDEIERKNLAIRFCTLSNKDKKFILAQLPNHTKDELLNSINKLEEDDLISKSSSVNNFKPNLRTQKNLDMCNSWNNFLMDIERKELEKNRNPPLRLLQSIKDISKIDK